MTTLQFFNENSSGVINQSNWDEDIFVNNYDSVKIDVQEESNFITNTQYVETELVYELKSHNKSYSISINNIDLHTIDSIFLKISCSNEVFKILFNVIVISLDITINKSYTKLIDSNLSNVCLLSYLNNNYIREDDNILTIPLIQFNHFKYGLFLNNKSKMYFSLSNYINDHYDVFEDCIFDDIKMVINGKKYHDINIINKKNTIYKPVDMNWGKYIYQNTGNYINRIDTKFQFITFTLIKIINIDKNVSSNDINEFINNQPEVTSIKFQHKDLIPWEYNLSYMKKIIMYGVNTYLVPFYPEFINIKHILHNIKNSKNGIYPYTESFKIIIGTKPNLDNYEIYFTFFGEWSDD